jgi:hypothetical protein
MLKKNARPYGAYYGDKKSESEAENVIEVNEDIADKNSSKIDGYHVNKAGKYCRNCNSIFESGNKFYQHL